MARREYRSGSIYYSETEGRWQGSLEAGWTERGTRRRIKVTGKTEAEARAKLKKRAAALETGHNAGDPRMTVKAWTDQWVPIVAATRSPSHATNTASQVRRWIVPTIGHLRLATLTPSDLRAITRAVRQAGNTSTTARAVHGTTMRMLKDAKREGYTIPDPVMLAEAPGRSRNDREGLEPADVAHVLRAIENRPDRSRWQLAILTGIRQGEALGLTWDRVDLDAGTIDVSWQLKALPYAHGCGGACTKGVRAASCPSRRFAIPDGDYQAVHLHRAYHLVRPKTLAGERLIALDPGLIGSLALWREIAPANPWGLVYPEVKRPAGASGTPTPLPARGSTDREAWEAIQKLARVAHPSGRPFHVHEIRNTTATGMKDEADVVVTGILGHTTIETSRIYQRANLEARRGAVERWRAAIDAVAPAQPAHERR